MKRFLTALLLTAAPLLAYGKEVLPFIDNDYPKALAQAKKKNVPLFVDAWAMLSHSCRSMRAFVFTDKALERYAGQFVWLAVDTENSANAPFLTKYPISVWPTLMIIDPKKESVAMRYAGGASLPQLKRLLSDGDRAARGAKSKSDEALESGDRLATEKKFAEAAAAYDEAIKEAPKNWSRLGRAAESLTYVLYSARDHERCATRALELYPRVKGTYAAFNVSSNGLACASEKPENRATLDALEQAARETLENSKIPLAGDDRSGLYETLIGAREAVKDEEGARKL